MQPAYGQQMQQQPTHSGLQQPAQHFQQTVVAQASKGQN